MGIGAPKLIFDERKSQASGEHTFFHVAPLKTPNLPLILADRGASFASAAIAKLFPNMDFPKYFGGKSTLEIQFAKSVDF